MISVSKVLGGNYVGEEFSKLKLWITAANVDKSLVTEAAVCIQEKVEKEANSGPH